MENKENIIKNVNENQNSNVEEIAYLMCNKEHIGVSNNIKDLIEYFTIMPEHMPTQIMKGSKDELLSLEQRLMIIEALEDNLYTDKLVIPDRFDDYNLIDRKQPKKTFFTVLLK